MLGINVDAAHLGNRLFGNVVCYRDTVGRGEQSQRRKADRVLKLLLGMRNARVIAALASRGFGQEDLDEGWELLRSVAKGRFDALPAAPTDPSVIAALDQWENTWFPIVDATLRRRYPALAEKIFQNLSQTEGPGVVLTVGTLLERISALGAAADGDSRAAMELVVRRGLTPQVLDQAQALLNAAGHAVAAAPVDLEAQREELARAERALWDWYLEWSQIVRVTITERKVLRSLGFLAGSRSSGSASTDEAAGEPDEADDDEVITTGPTTDGQGGATATTAVGAVGPAAN